MMNSKSSLTPSITPEIKKQGCASAHKGWKPFGCAPAPNHRSFSPPTAQDGALPLSSNQPIISKFGNNPVRRAAWGRDRNLLCVQSLVCGRSLGADWSGAKDADRPQVKDAPGGYRTCQGCGHRNPSSGKAPPKHLRDYPAHQLALNSSPSGEAPIPPYPLVPTFPEHPRDAGGSAAKHRAGLAGSQ